MPIFARRFCYPVAVSGAAIFAFRVGTQQWDEAVFVGAFTVLIAALFVYFD